MTTVGFVERNHVPVQGSTFFDSAYFGSLGRLTSNLKMFKLGVMFWSLIYAYFIVFLLPRLSPFLSQISFSESFLVLIYVVWCAFSFQVVQREIDSSRLVLWFYRPLHDPGLVRYDRCQIQGSYDAHV